MDTTEKFCDVCEKLTKMNDEKYVNHEDGLLGFVELGEIVSRQTLLPINSLSLGVDSETEKAKCKDIEKIFCIKGDDRFYDEIESIRVKISMDIEHTGIDLCEKCRKKIILFVKKYIDKELL